MCSVCGEPRLIPDFSGYRVYRCGQVETRWQQMRYWHSGLNLPDVWKPFQRKSFKGGYPVLSLTGDNRVKRTVSLHTIMLLAFVGPRPQGAVARHLDGDKQNSSLANLKWGTPSENAQDAIRHGTRALNRGGSKLTWALVREIRKLHKTGISQASLSKTYGTSKVTIGRVVHLETWVE